MFGRKRIIEDYREFTRELLLRFDRKLEAWERAERARHETAMAEIRTSRAEAAAHHERESRRIDDIIAENRAQRAALLAILDELRGNGGPAAAT